MTHAVLNAAQISRLLTAIKQRQPDLFDVINRYLISCKNIYVEYDLQGGYFLTFRYDVYYRQQFLMWNSDDDIHNYIMNGSENKKFERTN